MTTYISGNIASSNGLFPVDTKPLHEAMFDLSSKAFCGIHLRAISQLMPMKLIHTMGSGITYLNLLRHLPGSNELILKIMYKWFTGINQERDYNHNKKAKQNHVRILCDAMCALLNSHIITQFILYNQLHVGVVWLCFIAMSTFAKLHGFANAIPSYHTVTNKQYKPTPLCLLFPP